MGQDVSYTPAKAGLYFHQENDDPDVERVGFKTLDLEIINAKPKNKPPMRVTLAQLNPVIGDISGNLRRLGETLKSVAGETDLLVFPEMFLTGYPPQDLLERPGFIERVEEALVEVTRLSREFPEIGLIVGAPRRRKSGSGRRLSNCALLIHNGQSVFEQAKTLLPTYDVFDEARYFEPAEKISLVEFQGENLALTICEDAWTNAALWPQGGDYSRDPIAELSAQGATLIINISASPFNAGKGSLRYQLLSEHARKSAAVLVFVNQVGGNDELIFDGRSMCLDSTGAPIKLLPGFVEEVVTVDTSTSGSEALYQAEEEIASIRSALILGIRDYLGKCGFSQAVVGLSGGIDSALTFALAVQALGAEQVLGVCMPSRYSSEGSISDSHDLAARLGAECRTIGIDETYQEYCESLGIDLADEVTLTQENIQARIRGNILMAISNSEGRLTLSTGNKSELAVGYCTLYGDMSGGLAVIADLPKSKVFELARYLNRESEIIPEVIINKPPSAELKPDQMDEDTLPPYDILDAILQKYIEETKSLEEIVAEGYEREVVSWVIKAVNNSEYKRRQAAPGLRVTSKSFGVGRRMPIAAHYDQS